MKHFGTKTQEVPSNVAVRKKNEKVIFQTVRLSEIQSDAQVVNKKYFCR